MSKDKRALRATQKKDNIAKDVARASGVQKAKDKAVKGQNFYHTKENLATSGIHAPSTRIHSRFMVVFL